MPFELEAFLKLTGVALNNVHCQPYVSEKSIAALWTSAYRALPAFPICLRRTWH
jgi:hypothetical protein